MNSTQPARTQSPLTLVNRSLCAAFALLLLGAPLYMWAPACAETEVARTTEPAEPISTEGASAKVPSSADPASAEARIVEIEKADFGIVVDRSGPTKDWKLHPVVLIPNLAGVQYAWKIKTNSLLPIFVREEFTLPEAPSTWKLKEGETASQLLKGGEQCILESFQATDDGWIGHAWTASHGDPAGKYEIKVWLNGKLAHDFVFNVGESVKVENEARDW